MSHPEAKNAQDFIAEIRRTLRILVITTVALFIAIGAVGVYAYSVADDNRQAVCNLTADLERRVAASESFAEDHPEAVKKLGFTQAQVEHEIDNQRRTINALSVVPCD